MSGFGSLLRAAMGAPPAPSDLRAAPRPVARFEPDLFDDAPIFRDAEAPEWRPPATPRAGWAPAVAPPVHSPTAPARATKTTSPQSPSASQSLPVTERARDADGGGERESLSRPPPTATSGRPPGAAPAESVVAAPPPVAAQGRPAAAPAPNPSAHSPARAKVEIAGEAAPALRAGPPLATGPSTPEARTAAPPDPAPPASDHPRLRPRAPAVEAGRAVLRAASPGPKEPAAPGLEIAIGRITVETPAPPPLPVTPRQASPATRGFTGLGAARRGLLR